MKTLHPAPITPEAATVRGVSFQDAAGRRCVWPVSGAGADMVVCGAKRLAHDRAYCLEHRAASIPEGSRDRFMVLVLEAGEAHPPASASASR